MIQANELRIGNWVINTKTNTSFKIRGCDLYPEYNINEHGLFDQIPLTPEILEKAGFGSVNGDFHKGHVILYSGHDHFWFDWRDGLEIKVPYLHQLQNLYFALTGEELNIDL